MLHKALLKRSKGIISFLIIIMIWESISRTLGHASTSNLLPSFSQVFVVLWKFIQSESFYVDIASSYSRVLIGFSLGALIGLIIGLATSILPTVNSYVSPVLNVIRPIPPIALVPIILIWFGINEYSKYVLVTIGAFFPVWISTHIGISNVNPTYIKTAKCFGLKKLLLIRKILIPAAITNIISGARTALAVSFFCLVAAEMSGANSGLFYRINLAYSFFKMDSMIAGLIVLGLLSLVTDKIFTKLAQRYFPWIK